MKNVLFACLCSEFWDEIANQMLINVRLKYGIYSKPKILVWRRENVCFIERDSSGWSREWKKLSDRSLDRTFSIRSMHGCRSSPKSMNVHGIASRSYSSCSNMNMVWLKYCWSRSFVKFIQSWLKPFNCTTPSNGKRIGKCTKVKTISHK